MIQVTGFSIPLMGYAANLRSHTTCVNKAAGKGEAGEDGAPKTRPVSAVCLETREGQGDVDQSTLRKTMCHLKNTTLLHPTAPTWGPGRHDVLHFLHL